MFFINKKIEKHHKLMVDAARAEDIEEATNRAAAPPVVPQNHR